MIVHRSAIVVQAVAAVRTAAAEIVRVEVQAIARPALLAEAAVAAGHERQHHVVAWPDFDDAGTDSFDDAGSFMAEHDRLRHRIALVAHHHVGVAHARRDDTHQHFVRTRLAELEFFDGERAALLAHDRGADGVGSWLGHGFPPGLSKKDSVSYIPFDVEAKAQTCCSRSTAAQSCQGRATFQLTESPNS